MPLQTQTVEVALEGLDQKTDALKVMPGPLLRADNVEFDKYGRLNKRKGYQTVSTAGGTVTGQTLDSLFQAVLNFRGELVVLGVTKVWAIASPDNSITVSNRAWVERGPACRGAIRFAEVATSGDSEP